MDENHLKDVIAAAERIHAQREPTAAEVVAIGGELGLDEETVRAALSRVNQQRARRSVVLASGASAVIALVVGFGLGMSVRQQQPDPPPPKPATHVEPQQGHASAPPRPAPAPAPPPAPPPRTDAPAPARELVKAREMLDAGDIDGAVALGEVYQQSHVSSAAAHRFLGDAYDKKGDKNLARYHYTRYLSMSPNAPDLVELATIMARLKK
jgi:type IV secretory pathway VirB10-like protein